MMELDPLTYQYLCLAGQVGAGGAVLIHCTKSGDAHIRHHSHWQPTQMHHLQPGEQNRNTRLKLTENKKSQYGNSKQVSENNTSAKIHSKSHFTSLLGDETSLVILHAQCKLKKKYCLKLNLVSIQKILWKKKENITCSSQVVWRFLLPNLNREHL